MTPSPFRRAKAAGIKGDGDQAMSEMVERVAMAIAKENGDDFDAIPKDKPDWTAQRGIFAGRSRDINEPFQCDYLGQARAAIEAMREPTVDMLAAAYPCSANEEFSHGDKVLGAACCLKLGGGADIGLLEGEAVKQAAFLSRDYRAMIDAALRNRRGE
jgi:hypothetical protein